MGAEGIWLDTSTGFTSTVRAEVPVVGGALVTVVADDVWFAGAISSLLITVTCSIITVALQSASSYTSTACRRRQSAELELNAWIHSQTILCHCTYVYSPGWVRFHNNPIYTQSKSGHQCYTGTWGIGRFVGHMTLGPGGQCSRCTGTACTSRQAAQDHHNNQERSDYSVDLRQDIVSKPTKWESKTIDLLTVFYLHILHHTGRGSG